MKQQFLYRKAAAFGLYLLLDRLMERETFEIHARSGSRRVEHPR